MIELPANVECLAKIRYESISSIQVIRLSNIETILSRLPSSTSIQILAKDNKIKWVPVKSLKTKCRNKIDVDLYKVAKFGDSFVVPSGKTFELVTADTSILGRLTMTFPSYVLGLVALGYLQKGQIEYLKDGKFGHTTFKTFISNKAKYWKLDPVVRINKYEYDASYYIDNISDIIYDYVTHNTLYVHDVYDTELLIRNRTLCPLIFSNAFDVTKIKGMVVPYNLNWMLNFLYGDEYEVRSKLRFGRSFEYFHIPSLKFKESTWKTRSKKLQLTLDGNYTPVIINNNLPMIMR